MYTYTCTYTHLSKASGLPGSRCSKVVWCHNGTGLGDGCRQRGRLWRLDLYTYINIYIYIYMYTYIYLHVSYYIVLYYIVLYYVILYHKFARAPTCWTSPCLAPCRRTAPRYVMLCRTIVTIMYLYYYYYVTVITIKFLLLSYCYCIYIYIHMCIYIYIYISV